MVRLENVGSFSFEAFQQQLCPHVLTLASSIIFRATLSHHYPETNTCKTWIDLSSFALFGLAGYYSGLTVMVNLLISGIFCLALSSVSSFFPAPLPVLKPVGVEKKKMLEFNQDIKGTTLSLVVGDLFKQPVEAIVNTAQVALLGGGGVDGQVHAKAGPKLRQACAELPQVDPSSGQPKEGTGVRIRVGDAVVTEAFNIQTLNPSIKYVVHTVGPNCNISSQNQNRKTLLKNAYQSSLRVAHEKGIRSLAFPAISAGIYSYPTEECQQVALQAVVEYLEAHPGQFSRVIFTFLGEKGKITQAAQKAWSERFS